MKRKRKTRDVTRESRNPGLWARLPLRQIGIVAGVLILIGAVLMLKNRQSPAASAEPVAAGPTLPAEHETPSDPGDSVPLATVTPEATREKAPSPAANVLPEQQLDRLLQAGEPVFLFFHSNTCVQCVKMTGIVEEVYPEFSDSVALVDVDVYDEQNRNLLQRANIRAIPTLIFVDTEAEATGHVGVMESDALREQLRQLGEE